MIIRIAILAPKYSQNPLASLYLSFRKSSTNRLTPLLNFTSSTAKKVLNVRKLGELWLFCKKNLIISIIHANNDGAVLTLEDNSKKRYRITF